MGVVWSLFNLEALVLYFLHQIIDCSIVYIIFIAINSIAIVFAAAKLNKVVFAPFCLGYGARLVILFFDQYTLALSNMNGDIQAYFSAALEYYANPNVMGAGGGMYSKVLGFILRVIGPSHLMAAYTNVLLGMTTMYLLCKVLQLVKVSDKVQRIAVLWLALFPYSIYSSTVVYRETVIAALFMASVYCATRWFIQPGIKWILCCLVSVGLAAMFHAGSVVLAIGYFLIFIFYVPGKKKFVIRRDSVAVFLVILAGIAAVVYNPSLFLGKFMSAMEDSSSIIQQFNRNTGGSAYLTWLRASTLTDVILGSPLKAIYFAFSPIPMDWRGIVDAVTFAVDSLSYFYCIAYTIRHMKQSPYKSLIVALLCSVIAAIFVFGIGTWTAGTAIRHRNKIFAVILAMFALSTISTSPQKQLNSKQAKLFVKEA